MPSMTPSLPYPPISEFGNTAATETRTRVQGLLATLYPRTDFLERRQHTRYPFAQLIHLTPVAPDGITPQGKSIVAVGKHLSERGLGFFHQDPLPYRRMIVSLPSGNGRWVAFLIDLSWCRFTRDGWYESGGRFLDAVDRPITTPPCAGTTRPG